MASDPRPTIAAAPPSPLTHGQPSSSRSKPASLSLSSQAAHDGRRAPRSGVVGLATTAAKWVIGYDDTAPPQVSSTDYVRGLTNHPGGRVKAYLLSLFPFVHWLPQYNPTWALGDLIAGITVGLVLVPQSMSYAKLAGLAPEYGLYSSFVGVFVYCFFATSKDVSIGPVAVMSLEVGRIVADVQASHPGQWEAHVIATQIAFICGFIVLGIGLLRLGRIVEFIPVPAVAGFMTGSAISIAAGQVPALMGISKLFNTKEATFHVIINTLKNLKYSNLDAALGVPALALLFLFKWVCTWVEKRYPRYKRTAFFVSVTRNAFVIIIFTIIAWRITVHEDPKKYTVSILKTVPAGFQHVGQPYISRELISAMASKIPVATIILLLEHIAISKSFGRLNGYKINPNQELIAVGITNTLGSIFAAYPATGSFSRSALKSKSGVRTPAAGWWTGLCVIIALYALTDAFYWIPNAALSAIIIGAVCDLVVSPRGAYGFWRVSPLECIIFIAAVFVTIFSSIENGVYTSLAASVALLLFRVAVPGGSFLGRVKIGVESKSDEAGVEGRKTIREVYVPFNARDSDSKVNVEPPPPGVIIYRFSESFLFPNASHYNDAIVDYVKANTRRGKPETATKLGDRPWNRPGPIWWLAKNRRAAREQTEEVDPRPRVRSIVLDFSAVANLDTTGVQNLVDVRKELELYADGEVTFHFASITSAWVQRALVAGGFGIDQRKHEGELIGVTPHTTATVQSVLPGDANAITISDDDNSVDEEKAVGGSSSDVKGSPSASAEGSRRQSEGESAYEALISPRTPFFHLDLQEAVRAASYDARH